MKCIAITETRYDTEREILVDGEEKTVGGIRVVLRFRFTPVAPVTANIGVTFQGTNAKGKWVTKTIPLEAVTRVEADLLTGHFDLGQTWHDEWGGAFDINASSFSISIDIDGDEQPPIVIEDPKGPEFQTRSSNQEIMRFWPSMNYNFPAGARTALYLTSSAIHDLTDGFEYTITTDDEYLMPDVFYPTVLSAQEFQAMQEGMLNNDQANGRVFIVKEDGVKYMKIFMSNTQRNYSESYPAHEAWRVALAFERPPMNRTNDDHLTRIEDAFPHIPLDFYARLPQANDLTVTHWQTEMNTTINTYKARSDEVYLPRYTAQPLPDDKHAAVNDVGYIYGGYVS